MSLLRISISPTHYFPSLHDYHIMDKNQAFAIFAALRRFGLLILHVYRHRFMHRTHTHQSLIPFHNHYYMNIYRLYYEHKTNHPYP